MSEEENFIAYFSHGGSLLASSFEDLSSVIAKHYCEMDRESPAEVIAGLEFIGDDQRELSIAEINVLNQSIEEKFQQYEQEAYYDEQHVREISCPRATGRI